MLLWLFPLYIKKIMFDFKADTLTNTEGVSYKETTQAVPAFHRSLGFFKA